METLTFSHKIANLLVQQGKLSEKDRDRLLALELKSSHSLIQLLYQEGKIDDHEILYLLSQETELPILKLSAYHIDQNVVRILPQKIAERYGVIPIAKINSVLTLAASEPLDLITLDDLKEITSCEIRLVLAGPKEIQNALATQYMGSAVFTKVVEDAGTDQLELVTQKEEEHDTTPAVDEAPIVRMVNLIIQEAVKLRASDIHIEPYNDHFRIRYRIDGVLKEGLRHALDAFPAVIARIKILCTLDITEKRVPQDGRFKVQAGDREIDFRVSILPTFFGEKGVLRMLDKTNIRIGLEELGFSQKPLHFFKEGIRRPYGMILVTGPTGSGKSTTLYSVLNLLNTPERNLMTIEDPIEYQVEGITQTQVRPDIGLTFASGLRTLLRQSPDVILVGEIRDSETADIAVKAALTGHLVLSTLHTNSAAGAVTRLIDMGVEPFLIASSVILVAGQRLVRKICSHCKAPSPLSETALKRISPLNLDLKKVATFAGKGCAQCHQTGYSGRSVVVEALTVDADIRRAILTRTSSDEIEKIARKKGMETIFENALNFFKTGKTTLEEVLRVAASE